MLSEIERIFPTICSNMKIDIGDVVTVRKTREELFNPQYFSNKFWDIILLIYSHEINAKPINLKAISEHLDLDRRSTARYLDALFADGIICAYDKMTDEHFNLASDDLSLTQLGFENTGTIIRQTRKIFAQSN